MSLWGVGFFDYYFAQQKSMRARRVTPGKGNTEDVFKRINKTEKRIESEIFVKENEKK